ncbi:MAG: ferredoxin [Deltaproteobacteria bacterium]|nr:ferredoxin [Deltaproteobacteria bacterium]
MRRVPVIDIRECSDCGTCLELCPSVFWKNEVSGIIEIRELPRYPEDEIREAMSCCPKDCITWEQGD